MEKGLEPIKKKGTNKLTLEVSPLKPAQLLSVLQKTPAQHIYTRPGKGGGQFKYVTGTYVKKVLNFVFGWHWDFQIINKEKEGNQVVVHGRLTIKNDKNEPIIVKEQYGRADIKYLKSRPTVPVDYGNDCKAAATDALKKCGSELGIASDIYGANEFKEVGLSKDEPAPPKNTVKPATTPKKPQVSSYMQLKNKLFKLGAKSMPEAIDLFNKLTGENIRSLPIGEASARSRLFQLLNAPATK